MPNTEKGKTPDLRTPDVIENLPVRGKCAGSEIAPCDAGFAMTKKSSAYGAHPFGNLSGFQYKRGMRMLNVEHCASVIGHWDPCRRVTAFGDSILKCEARLST